jgi:3',5'-cyclic AMP phosphodiesterase CpdA
LPEEPTAPEALAPSDTPAPSEAPAPPDPGPRNLSPTIRLVAAIAVAGLGAVIVLGGLLNLANRSPTGGSSASAVAGATGTAPAGGASGVPASAAPTLPTGDPVLVGAGDIARCDGTDDEATAALIDHIAGYVFTLGDNAYDSGSAAELQDCYGPSWGRLLDRTRFAVAGNHDYRTDGAAPFRAYFGDAGSRDGTTWFSEDVGAWHVVVLDANCDVLDGGCAEGSAELEWLRADLAASTARCTLALWHQPRFSSGFHGDDTAVAPFWDVLYSAGADLVLNGHEHDYERFAPQDPAGNADAARGLTEIVVGTGGAPLREFGPAIANDVVRSSLAHGVLVLTLQPSGWGFRFVSTDGSFSDQGSGTCH